MADNPYPIQIRKRVFITMIHGLTFIVLICSVFGIFYWFTDFGFVVYGILGVPFSTDVIYIAIIIGIIQLIQIFWNLLYLHSLGYSLDNKNLTFKGGVISRFEKIIPFSKIQHVIVYETLWQRVFGLSSLSIETARESEYNTGLRPQQRTVRTLTGPFIPDLNKEDAEKLKNRIITISNTKYKPVAGI